MRKLFRFISIWLSLSYIIIFPVHATGDLSRQEPIEVVVELGNETNPMRFYPQDLVFETGKLYRMILHNPSNVKHYFSSDSFVQSIYTRKVMAYMPNGEIVAEIKGHVREVEVFPGHTADWWFVPIQTGTFKDLKCTVEGHSEAGMVGTITIK
jgi:uncharacterized cupredoxin-like copper-binding protein